MPAATRRGLGAPFWTLATSSALSNLADGVMKVALPLTALSYTRSPALVAGLGVAGSLPWLLGSLPVGVLVDRVDRKRAMLAANSVRAMAAALPAVALLADVKPLWLLYLVALSTGTAEVLYDTAAQSIVPQIVERSGLDRANGRLYAMELGSQEMIAPPVSGILVATAAALPFGTSSALWATAIAGLLLLRGSYRPVAVEGAPRNGLTSSPRPEPATSLRVAIAEGWSFLVSRPVLRTMALMVGLLNLATSASIAVLVIFAVGSTSALGLTKPQYGLLLSAFAAGGLFGGLVTDRVQQVMGRARMMTVSVVGVAAYIAAPAITTSPVAIGVVSFAGGVAVIGWNVITVSYRQRATPDHLLGRMNSTYRLLAWGTRPVGAALGGVLGELIGVRAVFAIMGAVALAVLVPNQSITEEALTEGEIG